MVVFNTEKLIPTASRGDGSSRPTVVVFRLVAPVISGTGFLGAPTIVSGGGSGFIRLEAFNHEFTGTMSRAERKRTSRAEQNHTTERQRVSIKVRGA